MADKINAGKPPIKQYLSLSRKLPFLKIRIVIITAAMTATPAYRVKADMPRRRLPVAINEVFVRLNPEIVTAKPAKVTNKNKGSDHAIINKFRMTLPLAKGNKNNAVNHWGVGDALMISAARIVIKPHNKITFNQRALWSKETPGTNAPLRDNISG